MTGFPNQGNNEKLDESIYDEGKTYQFISWVYRTNNKVRNIVLILVAIGVTKFVGVW